MSSVVSEAAVGRDARRLRRLAKQEAIEAARAAGKRLTNINEAVDPARRKALEALRDWYKGGQKGNKPKC